MFEVLKRKKSLVIDGVKFPLPRRISDSFFREDCTPKLNITINEKNGEIKQSYIRETRRTALSLQISRFARDRYLSLFVDKLRAYSETHADLPLCQRFKEICLDESVSLEDRALFAKKIYLQHLKTEKYD